MGGNDAYSGPGTGDVFFYGNTGEAADEPIFTELSQRRHVCGIFSARHGQPGHGFFESDSVP